MDKRKLPITKHKIQLVAFTNDSMISLKPCQLYNMSLASLQTKYHLLTALHAAHWNYDLVLASDPLLLLWRGWNWGPGLHGAASQWKRRLSRFPGNCGRGGQRLVWQSPRSHLSLSLSKLGLFSSAISIMPCIISKDVLITSIMLIHSQAVGIGQPRPFTTSDSWNRLSENQSICSSQYLWDSQYFYKSK